MKPRGEISTGGKISINVTGVASVACDLSAPEARPEPAANGRAPPVAIRHCMIMQ